MFYLNLHSFVTSCVNLQIFSANFDWSELLVCPSTSVLLGWQSAGMQLKDSFRLKNNERNLVNTGPSVEQSILFLCTSDQYIRLLIVDYPQNDEPNWPSATFLRPTLRRNVRVTYSNGIYSIGLSSSLSVAPNSFSSIACKPQWILD
jgi:hypothetical protein